MFRREELVLQQSIALRRRRSREEMCIRDRIKGYEEENDVIMISHGDCIEDARYVGKLVEERFGIHNILINYVGTVIGSHTGTRCV